MEQGHHDTQMPTAQDFLYPTVDGTTDNPGGLIPDQMAFYGTPLQYDRLPQPHQTQQVHQVHQVQQVQPLQSQQMDPYPSTVQSHWFQASYAAAGHNNGIDITGLIPGNVYSGDAHSSVSSTSSVGHTDANSTYSRNKSANSSTSSASSSPAYSYAPSKNDYEIVSDGSTPSSDHASPDAKRHSDFGKTKRSRLGCLTCRHRKKRCCETKPRCHECARLGLKCTWPIPGSEYRNKPKHIKMNDGMHYDPLYGNIKILRGIVEHRVDFAN